VFIQDFLLNVTLNGRLTVYQVQVPLKKTVCFLSYLTTLCICVGYKTSHKIVSTNNEVNRTWKEVFEAYLKQYTHFLPGYEQTSEQPVPVPRVEPKYGQICRLAAKFCL
jgi:hypothetical protein